MTRSSAIRRESAHLTWLYCTVQKAFQYETVYAWITSVTAAWAPSVESIPNAKFETCKTSAAFDSFQPVFNTLVRGEPLNTEPRNLA